MFRHLETVAAELRGPQQCPQLPFAFEQPGTLEYEYLGCYVPWFVP